MNICLLNDSFPPVIDGVANVVMNYADILTRKLDSNVIVGTPAYPNAKYDGYSYKVVAYPSFDTSGKVNGYRTGNPLSIREIAQMAELKPDIIHTHCPAASAIMARVLRKETGAPIVFTYHTKFDVDIARAVGEGFLKKETIKAMIANISACDDVWVVSEGAGENLRSLGYEGEYRVMCNGVDFPKGRIAADKVKEVTAPFDLPEGIPLFLFVGRMMKYKGLPIIVEAMGELSKRNVDFRMVFVGGGADAPEMQELTKSLGIACDIYETEGTDADGKSVGKPVLKSSTEGAAGQTGKVIFVGAVHDREALRAWNTRADLFIFPSVYDTNGIVVREAAACGLASVLIRDSCAAEGITHDRNGYLIEENAESMAALLEQVSGNLDHLHQVGQNAMDEIYISWEDAVKIAYDRYKELRAMVESGELGIRKHQSFEYLMNSAAVVLDGTQKIFVDQPKIIYEGMRENFQEFMDGFEDFTSDFVDGVEGLTNDFKDGVEGLTNDIKSNIKDFKNDFIESVDSITSDINDGIEKIKDNISDGVDIFGDKK